MQLPSGLLTEGVPPPCPVGRARAAPTEADWPVQSTGQRACGGRCPAPLAGVEMGNPRSTLGDRLGLVGPHCAPRPHLQQLHQAICLPQGPKVLWGRPAGLMTSAVMLSTCCWSQSTDIWSTK